MASWLWSGAEEDVTYPELKTPSNEDEVRAIAEEAVKEVLEEFNSDDGWTKIPFETEDIELFDIEQGENPIVPVKARGSVKSSCDKIWNLIIEEDLEKLKSTIDSDIVGLETLDKFGE
eukprot:479064_1